eukprot:NODE_4949_length_746_cov_21.581062_g4146_i0.p3 GENE.NODE_4949_length_746_cov_21.581062_g4146_i0~~NODE_4949_length_746_cov_21.581062_g4146_i0.p3  ORF type:complete len:64 (-),score=0.07 NODE_4949_length_746_cov_21.581062_g4146_i0:26-217(-)
MSPGGSLRLEDAAVPPGGPTKVVMEAWVKPGGLRRSGTNIASKLRYHAAVVSPSEPPVGPRTL